jgi:hypothetical protein
LRGADQFQGDFFVHNRSARFSRFLLTDTRSGFTVVTAVVWIFLSALFASPVLQAQAARGTVNKITLEDLISLREFSEAVLSPNGAQLAIVRHGQIALLPADGGWPVVLTTSPGGKAEISWSPDGSTIAFVSQGSVWVVPVSGGKPRQITYGAVGAGDHPWRVGPLAKVELRRKMGFVSIGTPWPQRALGRKRGRQDHELSCNH